LVFLKRQKIAQKINNIWIDRYGDKGEVKKREKQKIEPLPFGPAIDKKRAN
jgi:hypothetical protein